MVDIVDSDFHEIKYNSNMVVNISPSKTILKAWDWVLQHNIEFEFIVEGTKISTTTNAKERIREMLEPANFGKMFEGARADHDIDFLFINQEDLMAFKLRWV